MGTWGISENALPEEKLKSQMADFLNGLNSVGEINYTIYSEIFDYSMALLDKMYMLGKLEKLNEEDIELIKNAMLQNAVELTASAMGNKELISKEAYEKDIDNADRLIYLVNVLNGNIKYDK